MVQAASPTCSCTDAVGWTRQLQQVLLHLQVFGLPFLYRKCFSIAGVKHSKCALQESPRSPQFGIILNCAITSLMGNTGRDLPLSSFISFAHSLIYVSLPLPKLKKKKVYHTVFSPSFFGFLSCFMTSHCWHCSLLLLLCQHWQHHVWYPGRHCEISSFFF